MPDDMEVLKTLHAIQLDVQSVRARVEHESEIRKQLLDQQQQMLVTHNKLLLDPENGLSVRLKTVEGAQSAQKWAMRAVIGSFLAAMGLNIFRNISK